LNNHTTSFGPAPANVHNGNGFRRASAYDDPHPDRTAKVRLALAAAKTAPGTWHSTFCLAHEDSRPSGSLMIDARGRLAAKCHSQGCKLEDIKTALEQRGLLEKPRIVATYRYEYEDGSHAFDVVRFGMSSSLELFGLAPDNIMVPLICCIWRAALGHSDFGIHLHGHTGLLKSELAALAWQHYGALFASRGMPSWTSTPNFLQGLSFSCKNALLIIDDLLGADVSFADKQKQYAAADQIFRGLGNASARGRMNANTTLRATKPARCLILSTGEEEVRGESLRSRVWQIPVTEEDTGRGVMNFERLSMMQRKAAAGEFTAAMRGYLEYLAPRYGTVRDSLRHRVSECREKAIKEIGKCHARTPTMLADLAVGFETFTEAALGYGAISASQADEYKSRVWSALIAGATAQARSQASQEPAHRFLELVMTAVSAGKAFLAPLNPPEIAEGDESRRYKWRYGHSTNGLKIGWFDGNDVYLDADASYKAAREMSVDGSGISIGLDTLRRRLKDQGLLASTDVYTSRQSVGVRRTIEGRRRDVLHFLASTVGAIASELDAVEFQEKF
jgi:hypothetical protein